MSKRRSDIVGCIACVIFALLAFAFGFHMSMQIRQMESAGLRAAAIVTQVHTGAKNSKYAEVAFRTAEGEEIQTRSIFQMFVIRHEPGDRVTVLYDPGEPETAMIDNGPWNWDQPVFGFFGGSLLLGLAVLMLRSRPKQTG